MTSQRMRWLVLFAVCGLAPALAHADVHREGIWPSDDAEHVSLSFSGPRAAAIHQLAEAAGWSLVSSVASHAPHAPDALMEHVDIDVNDQPAAKVLELLLADGDYRVKRDGSMLAISAGTASALPAPPPTAAAPARGEDRVVTGSSVVIRSGETVGDLSVFGGSADVYGTVTGDIAVFGGALELHPGSHVHGDIAAIGGRVGIDDGARVDGDVNSTGGPVRRDAGAIVSGRVNKGLDQLKHDHHEAGGRYLQKLGAAIARAALMFALGSVLLALAAQRMEVLQLELEKRPMQAFALGALGLVMGAFTLFALCVTIIGIPVAIVLILLGVVGVYAGISAAFTLLGARLLRNRTENPYLHLALGCALYLALSALPVIGWLATWVAILLGLGLLVSTRAAGLLVRHTA